MSGLRLQGAGRDAPALQVLLTGKPCRNFQVLVAYSLLQMVRGQILQESMAGDDILLVRAASGQARPMAPLGPTLLEAQAWGCWASCSLCPRAGTVMGLTCPECCTKCFIDELV